MRSSYWGSLRSRNPRAKTCVRLTVEPLDHRWLPTILMVPSQYTNINAAMTAAQSGDIIQLDPAGGPYSGNNNSNVEVDKNITIESASSSVNAVIEPGDNEFVDAETANVSLTLQGLTIENGTSSEGALFMSNNGISLTLTNCTFTNNELTIYSNSASATITGCTFTGNGSSSGDGAIAWLNGPLNISNSTFTDNTSAGGGGVISVDAAGRNSPNTLTNCTFTGNSSAGYGGGVLLDFERDGMAPVTATNCLFLDNSTSTDGSVFACFTGDGSGSITVVNSSFFGNGYRGGSVSGQGTFAGTSSTPLTIITSIFYGDTTPNEISTDNPFESSSVTNSDIDQSGYAGSNGNIDADPQYVDAASGDLQTLPTSPVINAGTSGAEVPITDINGVTRDNPPDMGAYEYQIGVTNDAINLTQFQLFSGEVATFTDTDGQPAPATDFTATIYWGDGTTPTTGTIAQPGGAGNAYSVAASHTYLTSGAHTLTVTITTKGAPTPETAQDATSINVQSAAATHFSVSALSTATAGASFTFTVTALDAFDDTATGYTGTVRFTSTDGQAVLPADTTLTNGVSTFIVTLATAGIQTITATDTTTSAITGTSGGVLVSAAAATHFAVSVPSSAPAGAPFNVTVTALDAFDNTATGYTGTVHFSSSFGSAILPADSPLTDGTGSFSVTFAVGGTATISVADTTNASITGATNQISIDQPPAITSGNSTSFSNDTAGTFTVTSVGFPVPTLSEVGALPGGVSFMDNGNGTATLSGTPTSFGVFQISFTAHNGMGADATQSFTLDVSAIPPFAITPNQRFIAQVYVDLLGRVVDEPGMEFWAGELNEGVPATTVVYSIEHSGNNEFQTRVVEQIYEHYLRRAADPTGLQNGIAFLNTGATIEQFTSVVVGSTEYFQNEAGGTNSGFLSAIYEDALARPIDPTAEVNDLALLSQGTTRQQIAYDVLRSVEYDTSLVNYFYETFLRRPADRTGHNKYVTALQNGVTDQQVIASIVASHECTERMVGKQQLMKGRFSGRFGANRRAQNDARAEETRAGIAGVKRPVLIRYKSDRPDCFREKPLRRAAL